VNRHTIAAVLIVVAGFSAVVLLSRYLDANRVNLPESYADSDLDLQGKKLKGFALGAEGLVADWYWMRSLQYVGGKIVSRGIESVNLEDLTSMNPRLLYPMLDNATTLDPKLMAAYSFGATILPAIDANQAIELTEKGIRDNPEQWRLLQYLGYIHWRLKDYEKAADAYERGSQIPGAPPFFKLMAAKMRSDSGSRDTAREIYKLAMAEAPDASTKTSAELRLMELDSLDEREAMDRTISEFREAKGRCPANLREIVPQLRGVRLPADNDFGLDASGDLVDPSGVTYLYDPSKCSVSLDPARTKIPVH